jgi:hypothetical protein
VVLLPDAVVRIAQCVPTSVVAGCVGAGAPGAGAGATGVGAGAETPGAGAAAVPLIAAFCFLSNVGDGARSGRTARHCLS